MSNLSDGLMWPILRKVHLPIRDCVHYCGFRYGRDELNPYEQYEKGLVAGLPRAELRAAFVDFLRHYRPRTLGDALGLRLRRDYALWQLPWATPLRWWRQNGWVERPSDVVDVMTHFSERGIPARLVEREHLAHERSFDMMAREGYRPRSFGHARVVVLQGSARAAYLVTDGNHRISALSALGVQSLTATAVRGRTVFRSSAETWPLVKSGRMALEDALAVFDVYHDGNRSPARTPVPANLVIE